MGMNYFWRRVLLCLIFLFLLTHLVHARFFGVKTNAIYDAFTLNAGVEVGVAKYISIDLSGSYNPWANWKHWLVQPEVRYWFHKKLEGHFIGPHLHFGQYNFSRLNLSSNMRNHKYQGDFYGGGVTYGYQWVLGDRWRVESSIGLGYAYIKYDKYQYFCEKCGEVEKSGTRNYFGPTKISVSFTYLIFKPYKITLPPREVLLYDD